MPSSSPSLSALAELEHYWQWWDAAGVSQGYEETPHNWLEPAPQTQGAAQNHADPEARPAPLPAAYPRNDTQSAHRPASTAPSKIEDRPSPESPPAASPSDLPQSLDKVADWWMTSPDLKMASGIGPRILPVLRPQPKLLVISDMPDQDDTDILFSGASGKLLCNILSSLAFNAKDAAFVSPWPQHSLAPDMELDRRAYWSKIVHHLIGLTAPSAIMLAGKYANLVVTGKDLAENRRSLPNVNHDTRSITASASYHPRILLARPTMKRAAWKDWLAFGEYIHEAGVIQP